MELPAQDETSDNIVAFWTPERRPEPGDELLVSYRLYWGAQPPVLPAVARCVATRTGIGGVIGRPRTYYSRRFAVDFAGGALSRVGRNAHVEAVVTASRGKLEIVSARPLDAIDGWRAMFDLRPEDDSTQPINLRLYLQLGREALTETWLYQWLPPAPADRVLY